MLDERALEEIRADEPERDYAVDLVITAWRQLDTCRQIGMDVGPIPWDTILLWCQSHELGRDATLQVQNAIRNLDIERAQREASKRALAGATGAK